MDTKPNQIINEVTKQAKNKVSMKVSLFFGVILGAFALLNGLIPFIGCITFFVIIAIKLYTGTFLAEIYQMNRGNLLSQKNLISVGIISLIISIIEAIAGAVGSIFFNLLLSGFSGAATSAISIVFSFIISVIFGSLFTFVILILGVVLSVYSTNGKIEMLSSFSVKIKKLLKI
jgi:hypothetical protein